MSANYEINAKSLPNTVDHFLAKHASNTTTVGRTEKSNVDVRVGPEQVGRQLIAIC